MEIKLKFHDAELAAMGLERHGAWIDLRAAEDVQMDEGDFKIISLGVSMKIPKGYEAWLAPRSSTYKNFGYIQTNGVGVIEDDYCGEEDIWGVPALAMRSTHIHKGDRIAQFRIINQMEPVEIVTVSQMEDESRGGFGSTGVK